MVSSKRPDRRQTSPISTMINLNIPRMVSQSVPSGIVLHPCAIRVPPTEPGIAGASRLRCCLFRRMVSPKRPNRRQPNPNNTHPPHGVAKRPERFRSAPVCMCSLHTDHGVVRASQLCHDRTFEELTVNVRRRSCPSSSEVLVVVVRRRSCPSSSEVAPVDVREKACPSPSEVQTGNVRRKGEVPILPPPKFPESSKMAISSM